MRGPVDTIGNRTPARGAAAAPEGRRRGRESPFGARSGAARAADRATTALVRPKGTAVRAALARSKDREAPTNSEGGVLPDRAAAVREGRVLQDRAAARRAVRRTARRAAGRSRGPRALWATCPAGRDRPAL